MGSSKKAKKKNLSDDLSRSTTSKRREKRRLPKAVTPLPQRKNEIKKREQQQQHHHRPQPQQRQQPPKQQQPETIGEVKNSKVGKEDRVVEISGYRYKWNRKNKIDGMTFYICTNKCGASIGIAKEVNEKGEKIYEDEIGKKKLDNRSAKTAENALLIASVTIQIEYAREWIQRFHESKSHYETTGNQLCEQGKIIFFCFNG
uniref:Uncharacterized protein n=1 Tax=Panagrolaimus sp. ES5 TaxID=591445 RepID=A0AC34FD10_9BILA